MKVIKLERKNSARRMKTRSGENKNEREVSMRENDWHSLECQEWQKLIS